MKYFLFFIFISHQAFCQTGIDKSEVIMIGGIKQYILIKGKDVTKPLLLFLHGGPGGSLMKQADNMTGQLQEHFVVVQWDQRETGETRKLNHSPLPLTLDMFYQDTHELVDSLLKTFARPKLYLAGYSWGTSLGFYMADKYPQLLYAYIAISPVINQWESERIALAMLKEKVNSKGQKELAKVKIPFENSEQLYYDRKWLFHFDGKSLGLLGRTTIAVWSATWLTVWKEACGKNLFDSLPVIHCPVYFFAGKKDYQTNHDITEQYFNTVSAPKKDLFIFDDASHTLPETDASRFQEIIINNILPQTFKL